MPAAVDSEIWQLFKRGDIGSFQLIYDAHFFSLFEYGSRLTHDRELVKDAIHDLFVKLWNNKNNLADVTNIRPYLLVALRGNVLNKVSREKRVSSQEMNEDLLPFDIVFSAERALIDKETDMIRIRQILEGLDKLSSRQKEILYLRFYLNLSYEEIAGIMEISVKAAYKLNARAIAALKGALNVFLFSFVIAMFHNW